MSDLFTQSVTELMPGFNATFGESHPVIKAVLEKNGLEALESATKEWTLTPTGPGRFTHMRTGTEPIMGGRVQDSRRAVTEATEYLYTIDVPLREIRLSEKSKFNMAKLIQNYPELAITDILEAVAYQFVMGNHPDCGHLPTLNGQQNYTGHVITNQDLIEFAAPASQTGTVFQRARNSIPGWHNQYREVSSFAADGMRQMLGLQQDCSKQGRASLGKIDTVLTDGVSFLNFCDVNDSYVIVNDRKGSSEAHMLGDDDVRTSIPLKFGGKLWYEPAIDLTQFTAGTKVRQGIQYHLNTGGIEFVTERGDAEMDGKGTECPLITFNDLGRLPTYQMRRQEFRLSLGMLVKQLRNQGALAGTAIQ